MKSVMEFDEKSFQYPEHFTKLSIDFLKCCLVKNPNERKNIK